MAAVDPTAISFHLIALTLFVAEIVVHMYTERSFVAFSCCSCLIRWSMTPACRVRIRVTERAEFLGGRIT